MISNDKKELVAHEVIKVLYRRFQTFPDSDINYRNAPFHDAFLRAFSGKLEKHIQDANILISLSSWMHGLNTTLGQTFFENVAHILSEGEKRSFRNCNIQQSQNYAVSNIMIGLKNVIAKPNIKRENLLIFERQGELVPATNFSADNYVEENEKIIAYELKSVHPNAGEMRGEKQKILAGKAYLKKEHPTKEVFFYIAFPFDPNSDTPCGYNKQAFMQSIIEFPKYFHEDEVLIASELWDHLSGENNTMEQILEIINNIATPNFLEEFNLINSINNYKQNQTQYIEILGRWLLFSQQNIISNIDRFTNSERIIQRFYNQNIFRITKNLFEFNDKRNAKLAEYLNARF